MSERNPQRFENGSNARQRSPEEQRRLIEEYDQARYEEASGDEAAYNEAMAAREARAHEEDLNIHAETEQRVMDSPETRRMYMIAQQIAELRDSGGEPEVIADKENLLHELLLTYTNQVYADRDKEVWNAETNATSTPKGEARKEAEKRAAEEKMAEKIRGADFILESIDNAWVKEKLTAHGAAEETPVDPEKNNVEDIEVARLLADAEELVRLATADPEKAKAMGIYDKIRDLVKEIDEAIAKSKSGSEELREPKDGELEGDDEKLREPADGELSEDDKLREPKDGELDEADKLKEPKDGDLEGDDEEPREPADGELPDISGEHAPDEERGIFRRGLDRVGLAFTKELTGTGYVASGLERFRSSKKAKVVAVFGAIGIVGFGFAARQYGWFSGGGGHNADPSSVPPVGGSKGTSGAESIPVTPVAPAGPEIPGGSEYAHPWNWMKAAVENGSVTPPKGMSTEQALHYYGDQAASAGHKVEWYNLPNGLEAIRIDGHDDTEDVAAVLRQFAK